MTQVYEALLTHAGAGDSTGGVDTNHDVTLDNRGATENDWQN